MLPRSSRSRSKLTSYGAHYLRFALFISHSEHMLKIDQRKRIAKALCDGPVGTRRLSRITVAVDRVPFSEVLEENDIIDNCIAAHMAANRQRDDELRFIPWDRLGRCPL